MLKKMLSYFTLPLLLLLGNSSGNSAPQAAGSKTQPDTLQKMIVANGTVVMDFDLSRLDATAKRQSVRFEISPNSFFTIRVFNDVLRAFEPGSMALMGVTRPFSPRR